MKIAIVAFNNIKYSPYIHPYVDILKGKNAEIDLIYLNRNALDEHIQGVKSMPVVWDNQKNKAFNFLVFSKRAKVLLKAVKYDFVVVLTTFPAVLLGSFLKKYYAGRYSVDIRDFTQEDNKVYYFLEEKALKDASFRVISSNGFKAFLPNLEYIICNNISGEYKKAEKKFDKKQDKITIGYVGTIGYKDNCEKLINLVKDDCRFEFHFFGNESGVSRIKDYVASLNNDRIKWFGEYSPSQKSSIIEKVDLLFNVYGNDRALLKYALSNKLYDSMYHKKPLLVSPNTDMERETTPYSFSLSLETTTNLDELYNWYNQIDSDSYNAFADEYLNNVLYENEEFKKRVVECILGK